MKRLACVLAVVALAGCNSDGSPNAALWAAAADGFARGYGNGPVAAPAPVAPRVQPPLMVAPAPVIPPQGVIATWNGQSRQVETVTGAIMWECAYFYAGRDFLLLFDSVCPSTARIR
jgi:hypothetical protein